MTLTKVLTVSLFAVSLSAQATTATTGAGTTTGTAQEKFIGQNIAFNTAAPTKVVPFTKCQPKGKAVEAVRIRVLGEATKVDTVKLAYGNGVFDEIHVREPVEKNQSTNWIELKSGMRCVERVDVAITDTRAENKNLAPLVQVWGRVDDQAK